jgi:hypothetical protein
MASQVIYGKPGVGNSYASTVILREWVNNLHEAQDRVSLLLGLYRGLQRKARELDLDLTSGLRSCRREIRRQIGIIRRLRWAR